METRQLYYENSMLQSFEATALSCEEQDGGYAVVLDATAFYPGGGGQACDTGMLGNACVKKVYEQGACVVHLCDTPITPGTVVTASVDWRPRFGRMQQHTGEHIVSGLINKHFGYHNVGFHMGAELVTVDFDGMLTMEQLLQVEQEANALIWQDVPVRCWYPEEAELPQIPYRSKRQLPWPVRIVQIPGGDTCACCGTHVATTGQIGLVKIFSCVKFHQGVRVEMACGALALELLGKAYEQNRLVSQTFSAKILQTGEAAQKMNDALAAEKYRTAGLEKRLFAAIARQYAGAGDTVHFETGLSPASVRELAEQIAQVCGGTAAVFFGSDGKYDVCLADLSKDIKSLGVAMNQALCGRGGGKGGFFQGSINATEADIRRFFS